MTAIYKHRCRSGANFLEATLIGNCSSASKSDGERQHAVSGFHAAGVAALAAYGEDDEEDQEDYVGSNSDSGVSSSDEEMPSPCQSGSIESK